MYSLTIPREVQRRRHRRRHHQKQQQRPPSSTAFILNTNEETQVLTVKLKVSDKYISFNYDVDRAGCFEIGLAL